MARLARMFRCPQAAPLAGPTQWQRRRSRKLSYGMLGSGSVDLVLADSGPSVITTGSLYTVRAPLSSNHNH
jgi:hypothetical protein